MVPINNTTMETEMLGWLPAGSTCTTLRIPRGKGLLTPESLPAYKAAAVQLGTAFADTVPDVIAYGCTAAGFILGPQGDADIARDLARVGRAPVVTTARSMVDALQEVGARRIALLTPYQDDVNVRICDFLASGDIAVSHVESFYAADVDALGRITSAEVDQRARAMMDVECDALFIACSQLPTLDILESLQRDFGKPVLSSIQVTARYAMQRAGATP
jgi:maleate cis-trans isomerase